MAKQIRTEATGGSEFPRTVFEPYLKEEERRTVAPPVRGAGRAKDNDESQLDANPHFISINEAFPHIGTKLKACWGHQAFIEYIHNLIHDTRGNTRSGFPLNVLLALQSLSDEQSLSHPGILPTDKLWSDVEERERLDRDHHTSSEWKSPQKKPSL
jgi:hypothetical protein